MSVQARNFHRGSRAARAQAMVEFAIVAPILFLLLFGIFEVGRMIYVYSAVTNASREAVRYGSAVGYDDYGEIKYKHCGLASVDPLAGIRGMARRSAYFVNLEDAEIVIQYDRYDTGTNSFVVYHTCTGEVDPGYFMNPEDRVLVTVSAQYTPYTDLVPWGPRTFVSSSARTILGFVALEGTPSSTPPPTETPEPTDTPTATSLIPSDTPTSTATDTPTATAGAFFTFTPTHTIVPGDTTEPPTVTPLDTATTAPSATPANTSTATPTSTP